MMDRFEMMTSNSEQIVNRAGPKAQYEGSGEINGQFGSLGVDGYRFILTAADGQQTGSGGVDKFRITIRDKDNGGTIVSDNGVRCG